MSPCSPDTRSSKNGSLLGLIKTALKVGSWTGIMFYSVVNVSTRKGAAFVIMIKAPQSTGPSWRFLGKMNWLQSRTQFHISYTFSRSASEAAKATIGDLIRQSIRLSTR
eukprot:4319131-Amphidinium_carterae.2